jgi:hypothetical protein
MNGPPILALSQSIPLLHCLSLLCLHNMPPLKARNATPNHQQCAAIVAALRPRRSLFAHKRVCEKFRNQPNREKFTCSLSIIKIAVCALKLRAVAVDMSSACRPPSLAAIDQFSLSTTFLRFALVERRFTVERWPNKVRCGWQQTKQQIVHGKRESTTSLALQLLAGSYYKQIRALNDRDESDAIWHGIDETFGVRR